MSHQEAPTGARAAARSTGPARAGRLLWAAAGLLAALGVVMRFQHLGLQGYWSDELFTVRQTDGSLRHLWHVAQTEVHTPFFAVLVHVWIRLVGNTSPAGTRLLTAIIGAAGAFEAWWGLRASKLPPHTRAVLCCVASCSGFAIAHAQDLRPYALLWTASVGVTAAALRLVVDGRPSRRNWASFVAWGLLASAAHLFGLLLLGCLLLVAVGLRRLRLVPSLAAALVCSLPQALWLWHGRSIPGFAQGAKFPAPGPADVWHLVTTVFAVDDVHLYAGGIVWRSPLLVLAVALLVVVAFVARAGRAAPMADAERVSLWLLTLTSAVMVVATYVGSQVVHLWTTRNMIAVAPAMAWAAFGAITLLPATRRRRTIAAWACLALVAASTWPIHRELSTKYKTDFTGAARYIVAQREGTGAVRLIGNPSPAWATGITATSGQTTAEVDTLMTPQTRLTAAQLPSALEPLPGDTILALYPGISAAVDRLDREAVTALGGSSTCHAVPMQGVVLVRCHRP